VSLADSSRLDNGLIFQTSVELSAEGIKNSSAAIHPAGSVILSRDAGFGKSAVLSTDMAVSQHFICWTPKPKKLFNWFLYYHLQLMKPLFERNATGSTIKTIGLPFFKSLRITVPGLPEQQRIADCLLSLDEILAAQVDKVESLKTFKRGMLQQLLPSLGDEKR
jgi:type I restriction enzyme S subunit